MSYISKLKREHSLTLMAFHQTLGVHMLKHAKWGIKSKHDMQIHKKKTRIGLEPSSTATNLSIWSLVHIQLILQPLQRKQQPKHQILQGKKSKIRWRCDTYLNGMKWWVQSEEFWWKGTSFGHLQHTLTQVS